MKLDYKGIVFLTVIYLIILFLILYWRLNTNNLIPQYTITTPKDVVKFNLKTGDLLYSTYSSIYGKITKIITGSDWSHVALILNDNVVEVAVYPDNPVYDGLCIIPIKEWLKLNENRIIGFQKGITIDNKVLNNIIREYTNVKLDLDLYNWRKVIFKEKFRKNLIKEKYFCSELIAEILNKTGIQLLWTPASYSPKDIMNLFDTPVSIVLSSDISENCTKK